MRKAAEVYGISHRRGCRLLQLNWSSFQYKPKEKPDERALTMRLRDLAGIRVRYGYRRVLLQREGWVVGKQRVYRIYKQEGLEVRTQRRKKRAAVPRVPLATAKGPGQRWSMDFMTDKLTSWPMVGGSEYLR